jgi:Protein of unknown function (DUF3347)
MKGLFAAAVCLSVTFGPPAIAGSDALKAIVGSYLEIHAQLAADKTEGIKAAAEAIAVRADGLGAGGAALAKAAKGLAAATDLKGAREAFGPLSDAVIAMGQEEAWKDAGGVKVAFCPMVKRSWVQKEEKIRNPYYGSGMLECGEFKK